jgi:hypothetical protein
MKALLEFEIDPVWDSMGETVLDGTKLGVSKELLDGSTEADTAEL